MWRKWGVLLAFCMTTALNAFMFMNFATISSISKTRFHIDTQRLNWLYSGALTMSIPLMFPVAYFLDNQNWITSFIGIFTAFLTAWVRYAACLQESFALAVLSSLLLGVSSAVVLSTPTQLAQSWFEPPRRTMITSIAVQSNYLGWCLGGLVTPYAVTSAQELESFLFRQAILSCFVLAAFVVLHRPPPTSFTAVDPNFKPLLRNKPYLLHSIAFALLGAVSFTIPAVQDQVFHSVGFSPEANSLTNLAFILCGVGVGLVAGAVVPAPKHKPFLKISFLLTSSCLTLLAFAVKFRGFIPDSTLQAANIALMAAVGAGSLGFIGVGLSVSANLGKPVSDTYSGGGVEFMLQIISVILTQASSEAVGFFVCAVASWVATVVLFSSRTLSSSSFHHAWPDQVRLFPHHHDDDKNKPHKITELDTHVATNND
eukprot:c46634_g1_i1.p1 GENE.c46634_g1_i1~~c46634_g1_i1.p1  ORF type:complete len:428 (+),score=82.92 c46634_g1_i1:39-1322(+)